MGFIVQLVVLGFLGVNLVHLLFSLISFIFLLFLLILGFLNFRVFLRLPSLGVDLSKSLYVCVCLQGHCLLYHLFHQIEWYTTILQFPNININPKPKRKLFWRQRLFWFRIAESCTYWGQWWWSPLPYRTF